MSSLAVRDAGLQTTVQDLGRIGWAWAGVPVAGALDPAALAAANRCLGNAEDAAGLECLLRGPTLEADANVLVAVVGAGWSLGPLPLAPGVPYPVRLLGGLRCWVAVSGGIATAPVLGSRSTDTLSRLGGIDGRALRAGDVLPLGPATGVPRQISPVAGPALPGGELVVRITPGPHADRLVAPLRKTAFAVGPRSDRTALRLEGPPVGQLPGDITTVGVVSGAVQLPPDGQPLVLLGNCQTTGGYPVVGVVSPADLRLVVQLRPGAIVALEMIGVT